MRESGDRRSADPGVGVSWKSTFLALSLIRRGRTPPAPATIASVNTIFVTPSKFFSHGTRKTTPSDANEAAIAYVRKRFGSRGDVSKIVYLSDRDESA